MQIKITSLPVTNQSAALAFYTDILGFVKKEDIPVSGEDRWLTVISPEGHDDVELLLEPMGFEPARVYQKALYETGIPSANFYVDDMAAEVERLQNLGVEFKGEPMDIGSAVIATFDDTCGNLIQLVQAKAE